MLNYDWTKTYESFEECARDVFLQSRTIGWHESATDTLLVIPAHAAWDASAIKAGSVIAEPTAAITVYCWNTPVGRERFVEQLQRAIGALVLPVHVEGGAR